MRKFDWIFIIAIFVIMLVACKEGKAPATNEKTIENTFLVTNAWIRSAAKNMNSACYFDIVNNTNMEDTLLSAESGLAKAVQIHETFERGKDMKGMRHVEYVQVKANSTVKFEPSGIHVMLIGLNKDLKQGDTEKIILVFKNRGRVTIIAKVKKQ